MPTPFVVKNQYLKIGDNDISAYIKGATLTGEFDEVEVTASGDDVHNAIPGLANWSIEVECNQSHTAAELDAIIWPLVGAASASAIIMKPNGDTTGVNNPKWTGNGRIFAYTPIAGSVGDGATTSFTIKPGDGSMIVRATSD